ncbi:hypothetical protein ACLMMR_39240, partial [Streptomyces sp. NPDC000405]
CRTRSAAPSASGSARGSVRSASTTRTTGAPGYALVPATMPVTWKQAVDDWQVVDVDCLGRGTYLGVPRVTATRLEAQARVSYWSAPIASASLLCAPLAVARLIAAGRHRMPQEPEA